MQYLAWLSSRKEAPTISKLRAPAALCSSITAIVCVSGWSYAPEHHNCRQTHHYAEAKSCKSLAPPFDLLVHALMAAPASGADIATLLTMNSDDHK